MDEDKYGFGSQINRVLIVFPRVGGHHSTFATSHASTPGQTGQTVLGVALQTLPQRGLAVRGPAGWDLPT